MKDNVTREYDLRLAVLARASLCNLISFSARDSALRLAVLA